MAEVGRRAGCWACFAVATFACSSPILASCSPCPALPHLPLWQTVGPEGVASATKMVVQPTAPGEPPHLHAPGALPPLLRVAMIN